MHLIENFLGFYLLKFQIFSKIHTPVHTHTPQGEKFPKNSHPGGAVAGGGRKIFFGHTQCVHTPLVPKPVPTYDVQLSNEYLSELKKS